MRQLLAWILCLALAACSPTSAELQGARAASGGAPEHAPAEAARGAARPAAGTQAGATADAGMAIGRSGPPGARAAAEVAPPAGTPAHAVRGSFEHALLISVDGLRSDALQAVPSSELPNFRRMMNGAATLNARTDPDFTVTLPNHTSMITGRPVLGPDGHGWVENDDAEPGETLHKNRGGYVACMFDVAHDRGFHTALIAGKTKFALYAASYDAENGAPATEAGAKATGIGATATSGPAPAAAPASGAADAGRGRRKIDAWKCAQRTEEIADLAIANLGLGGRRSLVFVHFAATDLVGHDHGWDVTPRSRYMRAVATVDKELGRILDAIHADERLHGKTVVVLTADHGGGAPFKSHDQPQMWVDYIIPFLVWSGDGAPGGDLYALNAATRRDPGLWSPRHSDAGPPPIRNGDAGNLLLALLGLPAVPGSVIGARQDLRIR